MRMQKKIKNLETGRGVQYLLDAAHKILGNPVVMFDTNYSLIAYTNVATDDPIWNELITTGTFSMAEQEFFTVENFVEDVANADKLVVMRSPKLKYDRILGNIFNREGIKVANIVMVECAASFGPNTHAAFGALSDKITLEIQSDEYYTQYGRAYHDDLIKKILDDRLTLDTMVYTSHVQILYDGFEDYLYLAVADIMQNDKGSDKLEYYRELLKEKYPSFKFAIYSGYLLMIMSSKSDRFSVKKILGGPENPIEQNGIFTGISSSFENICDLHDHYDEAISALKNGISGNNRNHIFFHNA